MINAQIEHDCGMQSLRRWNEQQRCAHRSALRRGWIGCLLAALAALYLFILNAHAAVPAPADPELGLDWLPVLAWASVVLVALGMVAFVIWMSDINSQITIHHTEDDQLHDLPTFPKS